MSSSTGVSFGQNRRSFEEEYAEFQQEITRNKKSTQLLKLIEGYCLKENGDITLLLKSINGLFSKIETTSLKESLTYLKEVIAPASGCYTTLTAAPYATLTAIVGDLGIDCLQTLDERTLEVRVDPDGPLRTCVRLIENGNPVTVESIKKDLQPHAYISLRGQFDPAKTTLEKLQAIEVEINKLPESNEEKAVLKHTIEHLIEDGTSTFSMPRFPKGYKA